MSTTIDQRVVEMRFDNRHFEKNVSTTMSTLDKLKQGLNLKGASKGLENINSTANKVNMSGLGSAVETVQAKFSALSVVGVTALANITNSAVNAGKQIVKSLTIDPITSGFSEYELKMGSVQTILASTGESLETVNRYLQELNEYSDQTIYSFSDMTSNIGKFTNAGVSLEDAVMAIKGISNEAALSGANANEAARAMYNLSQAMSMGYVQYIDWKSIENANMATASFKDQLLSAAEALGTVKKVGEDTYQTLSGETYSTLQMFKDGMKDQWMTSDVLVDTLKDYADETTEIGKKATEAATKIKTFSQMMDTLKESAQSGWAETWELIFGDFNEGTNLWTGIGDAVSGVLDGWSNARNNLLEGALTSKWDQLIKKINKAGLETKTFEENLDEVLKTNGTSIEKLVEKYGSLEKAFQSGKVSTDYLKQALDGVKTTMVDLSAITDTLKEGMTGEDVKRMQTALDELGYDLGKPGIDGIFGNITEAAVKSFQKNNNLEPTGILDPKTLATIQEELKKTSQNVDGLADSCDELIESTNQKSGRELLIDSFKNVLNELKKPLGAIKEAWGNTFEELDADSLYDIIVKIHEFTEKLEISEDAVNNFKTICEGLFALFKLGGAGISRGLTASLKLVNAILGMFGMDLVDLMVKVAEWIIQLTDWIDKNTLLLGYIDKMAEIILHVASGIRYLILEVLKLKSVQNVIQKIKDLLTELFGKIDFKPGDFSAFDALIKAIDNAFERARLWIKTKDDAVQAGIDIITGLAQGIKSALSEPIEAIREVATNLIEQFKAMLGIASPSKVFIALGGFIIAGLVIGLKGGLGDVLDIIKGIAGKIAGFFQNIDWSAVFVVGTVAAVLLIFNKFIKVLDRFANPLDKLGGVFDGFKNLLNSFADLNKAKALNVKSDALLNIAKALALLVGSLVLLAYAIKKDWQSIAWGLGAITLLFGELFILAKMSEKMDPVAFGKLSLVMLAVGASLLLISMAIKKIASIDDTTKAWHAVGQIGALMVGLTVMMWAFGEFVKPKAAANIDKAGVMMLKMAVAIGVMAIVIKLVAGIDEYDAKKGLIVIGAIELLFAGMLLVFKKINGVKGDTMTKAGSMLLKMAFAIGVMVLVIKLIATMSWGEIGKGLLVIAAVELLFAGTLWVFKQLTGVDGGVMTKAGSMLLKMAVAIGIMTIVIKALSSMSTGEILKGLAVIGTIELLFAGTLFVFKKITGVDGTLMTKAGSMILKMSVAIGLMALTIRLLRDVSVGEILKCVATVAVFESLFAAIIYVSKFAGEHADKAGQMLLKMSFALLVLAGAIALLSIFTPGEIAQGTIAMGSLILAFAGLVAATKNIPKDCMTPLITMIAAFALMALAIGILAKLSKDGHDVLGAAASLTMVMLSIAAALKVMSGVKNVSKDAYIALGAVVLAMGLVAVVLGIMAKYDIKPSLETAASLSILLLSLAGVTLILSKIGNGSTAAIKGALAMDGVIIIIGGLLMGLGALLKYVPKAEEFLDKGIVVMQKIGEGLGSLIGGFFGGIRNGFSAGLPQFAEDLSNFMEKLQPFIDAASQIDPSVCEGVKSLAQAIIILTAANVWDSIASSVMGTSSLADFAEQLVPFGEAMKKYSDSIAGIDSSAIENSAIAAKALAEFADNVPNMGGLAAVFAGENSLVTFGNDLVAFGDTIKKYSDAIAGIDSNSVENSATAAKALAEFASNVPNTGGLAAIFAGENGITSFGWRLVKFGEYMSQYSEAIAGVDTEAVTKSATAGKALAQLASSIPNAGGLVAIFSGENGMGMFGTQIVKFGKAMTNYSEAIAGVDAMAVSNSATAGKALVELANTIPNTGGLISWITGENSMSDFSSKIVKFGKAMSSYSEAISGIDTGAVRASASAAQALANLANSLPDSGGLAAIFGGEKNLSTFSTRMVSFGKALAKYSETASGINTAAIHSSMAAVKNIANTLGNLQPIDQKNVSSLTSSINRLAQANVSGFVNTFGSASSSMSAIGGNMADAIAKGIAANRSSLTSAANSLITAVSTSISGRTSMFTSTGMTLAAKLGAGFTLGAATVNRNIASVVSRAASSINPYYSLFYGAGSYVVSGFAAGITASTWRAEATARVMAQAAIDAAKQRLRINSPSKAFIPLGSGVVEGFAKGINDNEYMARDASEGMADTTISSFSKAISRIQSVIDSDMDVQPTISPVLDLSDVKAKAGTIGDMLNTGSSMLINANAGAISTMMNRNIQNGKNGDVVSAIDKLRKAMDNVGGNTTYNVNGVTYDDGSNVTNAVKELVRYAKIERRV